MKFLPYPILLLLVFYCQIFCTAQSPTLKTGEYIEKSFEGKKGVLNYRILYPDNFNSSKKYPLVLFLHGAGERGADNETQLRHGSQLFLDSMETYPAIVIFPQCPKNDYWANLSRPDEGGRSRVFTFHTDQGPKPALSLVIELFEQIHSEPYIDDQKVYLSGLSMGAFGVFELLWRMPDKITAAIPICGGGPKDKALLMKEIPLWIIHGVKDQVVHPRYSITMLKAIQGTGGKARISLYPEVDHNAWDTAFAEPDFLKWLFSKRKK